MKDFFAVIAFLLFMGFLISMDASREETLYECSKDKESSPYFIGLKRDFERLKPKLKSFKEEECVKTEITRNQWYEMKSRLKYRRY